VSVFHSLYFQQKYLQPKKERWTGRKREIEENEDKTRDKNREGEGEKTDAEKTNLKKMR
jgi:hypothetical protein